MKTYALATGAALAALLVSCAVSASDAVERRCIAVNIQNQRSNQATVQQHCERNISRTVQAGARNSAATSQTGSANDNVVRQYWYDRMQYLERIRYR